jgi:hypothetical protein
MGSQEDNLIEYKVSLVNSNSYRDVPTSFQKCSLCFMTCVVFFTLITGLFTMISSLYILITNIIDITYGSELCLLISSASLILISLVLLISTCNYTNHFAKFILFIFSVLTFIIFAVSSSITIYIAIYFNSNGLINITEVDSILNHTMYYTYDICCDNTNTTEVLRQVCYDIIGHNETMFLKECSSFSIFEDDFLTYVHNVLMWVLSISGIVAIVNLISGITSCCLIAAYKRIFYYKNPQMSM